MSGGVADAGVKGDQAVVLAGRIGCGGDADVVLGGITDGRGGDVREGDGDGLSRWEDNVAHVTLVTEPNGPFAYAPGLENHHLIMSMLGDLGGRLDREG